MNFIWDKITEWLKGLLISGIMGNLEGLFDSVNEKINEVAGTVGATPQSWNGSVFNMIKSLSENVIVPIAGIILTFVMCYELIQMVIDKNSFHDFETFMFFKWNIIMGIFDVAHNVVNQAAGVIVSEASLDISNVITDMEASLQAMDIGPLFGLWFQTLLVGMISWILSVCIFIIVYGRMIEVYLVTSLGPIPLATMANHEWGHMGQNYLRSLLALAFQAFLIIVCVAIYAVLVQTISVESDVIAAVWTCIGYSVLLCFTLFKTSSLSKAVFGAH